MQLTTKAKIGFKCLFIFLGVCGTVAVVDGTYGYHHYMQDNFNDDVSNLIHHSFSTIKLDAPQSIGAQMDFFHEG